MNALLNTWITDKPRQGSAEGVVALTHRLSQVSSPQRMASERFWPIARAATRGTYTCRMYISYGIGACWAIECICFHAYASSLQKRISFSSVDDLSLRDACLHGAPPTA